MYAVYTCLLKTVSGTPSTQEAGGPGKEAAPRPLEHLGRNTEDTVFLHLMYWVASPNVPCPQQHKAQP